MPPRAMCSSERFRTLATGVNITAMAEYKPAPNVGMAIGFRYLDLDRSKGSGLDRIEYDLAIQE